MTDTTLLKYPRSIRANMDKEIGLFKMIVEDIRSALHTGPRGPQLGGGSVQLRRSACHLGLPGQPLALDPQALFPGPLAFTGRALVHRHRNPPRCENWPPGLH